MQHLYVIGIWLRLLALYVFFVIGLRQIAVLMALFSNKTYEFSTVSFSVFLLNSIFPTLFAITIWLFPLSIAKLLIPKKLNNKLDIFTAKDLAFFVICFMGLFFLINGFLDGIYWATIIFFKELFVSHSVSVQILDDVIGGFVASIMEFIIGLALLIWSKKIQNLCFKF